MRFEELTKILYHGSSTPVSKIDLTLSAPNKDFGKGFYCTTDRNQAEKFARIKAKRAGVETAYISRFEFIEHAVVTVRKFPESNSEWFDFVLCNRGHSNLAENEFVNNYDIVMGPVANDAVGLVLNQFIAGTYGSPLDPESKKTAIRLLLTQNLRNQVFFGTENAVDSLKFIEVTSVRVNG